MQYNSINVCRFCLKLVHSANVDLLNDDMREVLSLLSLKLDLDASEYPLVCHICSGVLDEIYQFKSKSLYTEDIISAHIEIISKFSLRDILIEIENKCNVHIGEDKVVCRLCMKIPPNCSYIALGETGEEISLSKDMIQIHLPEMDLNITKNPIICEACHVFLKKFVSFAMNCIAVEEKIKFYCESQKSSGPVDLACVRQFMDDKAINLQTGLSKDLVIKQEESLVNVKVEKKVQDAEDYISEGHSVDSSSRSEMYLKHEEIDIKSENDEMSGEMGDSLVDEEMVDTVPSGASSYSGKSGSVERKGLIRKSTSKRRRKTSHKDKLEVEVQTCVPLPPYKTGMLNQQFSQKKSGEMLGQREKCTKLKCEKFPYKTDIKSNLRTDILIHKDKKEVKMYKCENCEYQARYRSAIIRHMVSHGDPRAERKFKCDKCPYETNLKSSLCNHNLRQKEKSEVEIHKCDNCEYETRYKSNLIKHMLKHRDPKAERKFKCDKCPYETDLKPSLRTHNLKHKDKSEVKMHKCENCGYETRYKSNMINHMLKHRDPKAKRKFKCDKCPYETYSNPSLWKHNLKHKDKPEVEVEMQKCENCEYETRYKSNMIKHMLKHRDPKAERKFKCDKCPYETDLKPSLRTHNLKHKDKSEVKMHKCENCEYETRYKSNMIPHILKHHDPQAQRKFKCDKCSYETDLRSSLWTHNLKHKDKSEVKMHKCEHCEYETRYKSNMIQHILKHHDPQAERKFKCDKCSYETDLKSSLRRHNLKHKV